MYIYVNYTLVYSRKSFFAPPLIAPWSVFQPCSVHDEQTGFVIFFIQTYIRGGSMDVLLFFTNSPQKFKMKMC